jgi:hypothetical protein
MSHTVLEMRDRQQPNLLLPARLLIGRREEFLVLTVESDAEALPYELVLSDGATLVRQLAAPTGHPIALLLRTHDADGLPRSTSGLLTISEVDGYKLLTVEALSPPPAPLSVILRDAEAVLRELRELAPPLAQTEQTVPAAQTAQTAQQSESAAEPKS